MNGYQSPAEHARQVARVKRSLALVGTKAQRPDEDMRRACQLRKIERRDLRRQEP